MASPQLPKQPDDYFDHGEATILEMYLAGKTEAEIVGELLGHNNTAENDIFETDFDIPSELKAFAAPSMIAESPPFNSEQLIEQIIAQSRAAGAIVPYVEGDDDEFELTLDDMGFHEEPSTEDAVREAVSYLSIKWERYLGDFPMPKHQRGRPTALSRESVGFLIRALKQRPSAFGYSDDAQDNVNPDADDDIFGDFVSDSGPAGDGIGWNVTKLLDCLWRWGGIKVSDATLRRVLARLKRRWNGQGFVRLPDGGEVSTRVSSEWQPGAPIGACPTLILNKYTVTLGNNAVAEIATQDAHLTLKNDIARVTRTAPFAGV